MNIKDGVLEQWSGGVMECRMAKPPVRCPRFSVPRGHAKACTPNYREGQSTGKPFLFRLFARFVSFKFPGLSRLVTPCPAYSRINRGKKRKIFLFGSRVRPTSRELTFSATVRRSVSSIKHPESFHSCKYLKFPPRFIKFLKFPSKTYPSPPCRLKDIFREMR
jgi:hypothetical protein